METGKKILWGVGVGIGLLLVGCGARPEGDNTLEPPSSSAPISSSPPVHLGTPSIQTNTYRGSGTLY